LLIATKLTQELQKYGISSNRGKIETGFVNGHTFGQKSRTNRTSRTELIFQEKESKALGSIRSKNYQTYKELSELRDVLANKSQKLKIYTTDDIAILFHFLQPPTKSWYRVP
jgi:hypothetical protein